MSKTPWLYRFGKFLLSPLYRFSYKPTILGADHIPDNGPMLLAGNHIHLYDQFNTIICTKRFLTYMAKKEYFEKPFSRFIFKSVGCIPVDRYKKDNVAVESALEVLNNKEAVGIFPEGTRNALKEEKIKEIHEDYFSDKDYNEFRKKILSSKPKLSQINLLEHLYLDKKIDAFAFLDSLSFPDTYLRKLLREQIITREEYINSLLLPLKFGTVSMAQKTGAKIVPMIITGNYKFRGNNLVIRYGKPFKVNKNENLEKANNKLRREMLSLIEQSLKGDI